MKDHQASEASETATESPERAAPRLATLARDVAAGGPSAALALQRSVGNAAVARLVRDRAPARTLARESIDSRMPSGMMLDDVIVTVGLPADVILKESTFADLKTSPQGATVTIRVSRREVRLYFSGVYAEGKLASRTYVKSVRIGLSGGYIIPEVEKTDTFGFESSTKLWLELHQWLKDALSGVLPLGSDDTLYDAFQDSDPQATATKIADALAKQSGGGGSGGLSAKDVKVHNAGARVITTSDIKQEKDGAGILIPKGTAIGLMVDSSGATVADLQGASGPQGLFSAAKVKRVRLTSQGITVVKDGDPVASVTEITLAGGLVTVTGLTLLGKAKEYAESEAALKASLSILFGIGQGLPPDLALQKAVLQNPQATIVPGLTRKKIEAALQAALNEFVAKNGSTIGGVDLSSVLGKAPAAVP